MIHNLIIGSSPIMLLKALKLAKKGKKVFLIDKENSIGGAWKCFFYKGKWYEGACHILDNNRETYDFFNKYGISTIRVKYKIFHLYKGNFYDLSNISFKILLLSKRYNRNLIKKIYIFIKSIFKVSIFQNRKFYFFKNGSKGMLDTLINQCNLHNNIEIKLNTEIINIKKKQGHFYSVFKDGAILKSKKSISKFGFKLNKKENEILKKLIIHILITEKIDFNLLI